MPSVSDEESAKQESRRHIEDGSLGYTNADVVVKIQGWNNDHVKSVAQASLGALKQLILSDKDLPGLCICLNCEMAMSSFLPSKQLRLLIRMGMKENRYKILCELFPALHGAHGVSVSRAFCK